uniref:NADH-ubiquinone oxidoreductase chain 1 n=1 Tax=Damon diadema TaxID=317680 RepID=B5U6L1_9ARAC|nr:NADH dehydrogenase subunit 1 [Damon diadema]ACI02279.1 NADH dehydrogenase subunit 1 [Damon diadema]
MLVLGGLVEGFLLIVCVLIGVAFLTLFERKVLGYVQCRRGPGVVGAGGFLQPFADAVSLMISGYVGVGNSNYFMFMLVPICGLFLAVVMWLVAPFKFGFIDFSYGIIFFLVCSSLGVYIIMLAGWVSNSKYGLLGSYRAVAQTISYEVSMALILLLVVMLGEGYMFSLYEFILWPIVGWGFLVFMWVVTCVAELNRTPFDFAEGESELVSGFNVEFSGGEFALIFIAEYSNILLLSAVSVWVFMGENQVFKVMMMMMVVVWLRGVLVRYRYDKIMMLVWKGLLPVVMGILVYGVCLMFMVWVL